MFNTKHPLHSEFQKARRAALVPFASKGHVGWTAAMIDAIGDKLNEFLEKKARFVWHKYREAISDTNIDYYPELDSDLKARLAFHVDPDITGAEALILNELSTTRLPISWLFEYRSSTNHILSSIHPDVDTFCVKYSMPKQKPQGSPPLTTPSVLPKTAIDLIDKQIERAKTLLENRPINVDQYSAWENTTRDYLEKAFGKGSRNPSQVVEIGKFGSFPSNAPPVWWDNHHAESLKSQITMMESLKEILQTEIEIGMPASVGAKTITHTTTRRVFVVHGHNDAVRETAARFLERLDLEPVILHEQPNKGRTIIEKFTDHTDVAFALILFTADDRGGVFRDPYDKQKPRARQNVVLELGFFLGKLTRDRVCVLYEDGVEIPTDYSGVVFVKLDAGGAWKLQVAKELKAAGIEIDMNKALF